GSCARRCAPPTTAPAMSRVLRRRTAWRPRGVRRSTVFCADIALPLSFVRFHQQSVERLFYSTCQSNKCPVQLEHLCDNEEEPALLIDLSEPSQSALT